MEDRFHTGMIFVEELVLDEAVVRRFADFSGDRNPVHVEPEIAREYGFARPVAHGAILTAVVSRLIGMKVPGPGAVWMNQQMEWLQPAFVGDTVKVEAEITSVSEGAQILKLALRASNQRGEPVMTGTAQVKLAARVAPADEKSDTRRVALVTGGSRGIGAAIAAALAKEGHHVAITYHTNRAAAQKVVSGIETSGGRAEAFPWDGSNPESAARLLEQVREGLGAPTILVHAAAENIAHEGVADVNLETFRQFQRVHVESALLLVQAALPDMEKARFGRIVLLGTSYLSGQPPVKLASYIVAKSALWGLARCLATELGPRKITTNMISPGMTVTDLTSDIPQRIKEAEARRIPVRRMAVPQDIATLIVYLASEEAAFLNGENISLTGGPV